MDFTLRHDFVGAGHNGLNQGQLRNPDNPDKLLDSAAADKIRHYRAPYRQNRHVAFLPGACGVVLSINKPLSLSPRQNENNPY